MVTAFGKVKKLPIVNAVDPWPFCADILLLLPNTFEVPTLEFPIVNPALFEFNAPNILL